MNSYEKLIPSPLKVAKFKFPSRSADPTDLSGGKGGSAYGVRCHVAACSGLLMTCTSGMCAGTRVPSRFLVGS